MVGGGFFPLRLLKLNSSRTRISLDKAHIRYMLHVQSTFGYAVGDVHCLLCFNHFSVLTSRTSRSVAITNRLKQLLSRSLHSLACLSRHCETHADLPYIGKFKFQLNVNNLSRNKSPQKSRSHLKRMPTQRFFLVFSICFSFSQLASYSLLFTTLFSSFE